MVDDTSWINPGGDEIIDVRECGQCHLVIRHPIRWCSNCGRVLQVVKMTEREYFDRSHQFYLDTGWEQDKAKFDHKTGKPLEEDRNSGKEQE